MNKIKVLILSVLIVIVQATISHLSSAGSQMLAISIMGLALIICNLNSELKAIAKSLYLSVFTILADAGVKLFATGNHDSEGQGWFMLFLLIGLLVSIPWLCIAVMRLKNESTLNKVIAIAIYPISIYLYLYFFNDLGINTTYAQ